MHTTGKTLKLIKTFRESICSPFLYELLEESLSSRVKGGASEVSLVLALMVLKERAYLLCEDLAKLYTPLVVAVDIPDKS